MTKGARHKIILNIEKLRERPKQLKQLAKDIQDDSNLKMVLIELRAMIQTPIRLHPTTTTTAAGYCSGSPPLGDSSSSVSNEQIDDENLPAQITKILGKGREGLFQKKNVFCFFIN